LDLDGYILFVIAEFLVFVMKWGIDESFGIFSLYIALMITAAIWSSFLGIDSKQW